MCRRVDLANFSRTFRQTIHVTNTPLAAAVITVRHFQTAVPVIIAAFWFVVISVTFFITAPRTSP